MSKDKYIVIKCLDQDEIEDPRGEGLLPENMMLTDKDGFPRIFNSINEAEFMRDHYEPKGTCVHLPIY